MEWKHAFLNQNLDPRSFLTTPLCGLVDERSWKRMTDSKPAVTKKIPGKGNSHGRSESIVLAVLIIVGFFPTYYQQCHDILSIPTAFSFKVSAFL